MPAISVIIPTFNHGGLVLQTLESVFAQTLSDYEVIVVNDGSPDNTAEVLAPLVRAGRIIYIEQPNSGQAAARNRGFAEAKGEYIAFLDDDDWWPADKLEWQISALQADENLGVVAGTAQLTYQDGKPPKVSKAAGEITFASLFRGNPIISPGQTLIRAKLLRSLGGWDQSIWGCDDWDLWFRACSKSAMIMQDRIALHYRVHTGNASRNVNRMLKNAISVVERHVQELPESDRRAMEKVGWRTLFSNFGQPLAGSIRSDLSRLRLGQATTNFRDFARFLLPSLRDAGLCAAVAKELVPSKIRDLTRRRSSQNCSSKRIAPTQPRSAF